MTQNPKYIRIPQNILVPYSTSEELVQDVDGVCNCVWCVYMCVYGAYVCIMYVYGVCVCACSWLHHR